MSAGIWELLDFTVRWMHVIAGIMWIGNSMLFNWLDRSLEPAPSEERATKPIGTIWLLHSGGFYYVEKTLLGGQMLPTPLHWFKWQAYTTWLTGAALLFVVYYLSDRAVLADPSVANFSHRGAVLVGIGAIVAGWSVYELMQRVVAPRAATAAAVVWLASVVGISIALTQLLSGRAAFLHVGAILATIMAGNVCFTIVPSQRELVASIGVDRPTNTAVSARAKRVSIHNNYLTFPVIALMVSNHFPAIYGSSWNWLLLLLILTSGVVVRHILNVRFTTPSWRPILGAAIAASAIALYGGLSLPPRSAEGNDTARSAVEQVANQNITVADVRRIIDRRCAACHSAQPSDLTFGAAPAGVMFDSLAQIVARADRIRERAVVTKTMPPGNKTHITELERAMLGRWIALGALPR